MPRQRKFIRYKPRLCKACNVAYELRVKANGQRYKECPKCHGSR